MNKLLLWLIMLFLTPLSFAEELPWNEQQGPFVEFTAGTNVYYLGLLTADGKVAGTGITGAALGGALGYNSTHHFGFEGGLLTSFVSVNDGNQMYTPYLTSRFTVPYGERFSLLLKIGLMETFVPDDGGLILPFTGIGGSYALSQKLELGLQYQGVVYGIVGVGVLGLSVTYHF